MNLFLALLFLVPFQQQALTPDTTKAPEPPAARPRIFVTDSSSWSVGGSSGGNKDGFGGHFSGGARPQTAEIIKTFTQECKDVLVTTNKEKADYVVILEHEGGKGYLRRDNKFALASKDGDIIATGSTRSLGNSVKDACAAIRKQINP